MLECSQSTIGPMTRDDSVTTWGQAVDYTFRTRDRWRHGNGAGTARINTGHFTRLRGRSFPLKSITNQTVTQLCIELEEEGMSDATINRVVSAVSTVMNHLAFDGIVDSAPRFRRRREVEHRLTWFTKEEVEQLVMLAEDRLSDIILAAGYTGLRQGELLELKAQDVDLSDRIIHVGGRPGFTTKAANYRSIPIHPRIYQMLSDRLEESGATIRIFGEEWNDRNQLMRAFAKVRASIGKDSSHVFHSLRHSFGTWCIEAGVNVRVVMELLGHKRIETTLRYAKVSSKVRTEAILSI
jgi:integrase